VGCSREADKRLAVADGYRTQHRYANAVLAYRSVLAVDAKNLEATRQLGMLQLQQGEIVRAYHFLLKASRLAPADSQVRRALSLATILNGSTLEDSSADPSGGVELAGGVMAVAAAEGTEAADRALLSGRRYAAKAALRAALLKAPADMAARHRLAALAVFDGDSIEAATQIDAILASDSNSVDGLVLRGIRLAAKGDTAGAKRDLRHAVIVDGSLAPAWYRAGLADLQTGNVQEALKDLELAAESAPNLLEAAIQLSSINSQLGNHQAAVDALKRFTRADPASIRGWILLGEALLANNEPGSAAKAYREIVKRAPQFREGPFLVGRALLAQGNKTEARRLFELALTKSPDFFEPLNQISKILIADEKLDEALERTKRQVSLAPRAGGVHEVLGIIHETREGLDLAIAEYKTAIQLDPGRKSAYLRLADLFRKQGNLEGAIGVLGEAARHGPRDPDVLSALGITHQQMGNVAKAQQVYEQLLAINPGNIQTANNLAVLRSAAGQNDERTLRLAETAFKGAPDNPRIWDTLGWIIYKYALIHPPVPPGTFERAAGLLQRSADQFPNNAEMQYHLGMVLTRTGQKQSAREALDRAVRSSQVFAGKEDAKRTLDSMR
jgi:tetratricopeptide (TPR) repeat protein